ncbi:MAG: lipopolysaccharide biosynthesis protein [Anaerovoracaceae bacterium]
MSLKTKTIHGAVWSFVDNIASSGITFLVGIILARLLTPEEFGVLGMLTIFIAISNSFVDSGFSNALIRKNDVKAIDYNTVFYFNILIGIGCYIFLFIASPAISRFFREPQLLNVTRVLGLVLIINALAIIQRTQFIKKIDFKTQAKISIISSLSSGSIGVGMAFAGCDVWSLVGQQLSRQFFNTLFLWIYSKWRPAWEFSWKSFHEMFSFGSKLLVSGLLETIYQNIYYLIIGRFYSSGLLGQYTRAEQFNTIFSSNLTSVVQRVSFPVLSSIQEEEQRLKEAYRRVMKMTMFVTFACMLGLAATAKPLILLLIGEKWLPAVAYLQIICFSGMLYPLHAINLNILQVKGRSDIFLKLEIIKKCIGVMPIVIGIFYGIEFMLLVGVIISMIAYFFNSYYSGRLINYSTWSQIRDILPMFGVSLFVAICMWGLSFLDIPNMLILPLQCIVGIMLAIIIYKRIKLPEYFEIKEIVFSVIKQ